MDLRQMEYLVALADEQQFTRAAALCGVSQSGLSAAVRSLEDELGTTLFHRTTRRVEPTDAGLALLPHARAMLAASTAARDAVVRVTRQVTGTVRVGAEQCLAVVDPPALLERFHERYPHVEIHFTQDGSHDLLAQLRADELDVAFVATADHLGALERTPIASEPIVLLAPSDHPLAARGRIDWPDLDGLDFVDFQRSWGVRPLNDAACESHGVRRRVRCTVNDIHTLLDLVHRGLGVALVPRQIGAKPQADGLAVLRLPDDTTPHWQVSAVTGSSDHAVALAPRLLELLDRPAVVGVA
jgi:DNA-binding transcriptional LysR family regulator